SHLHSFPTRRSSDLESSRIPLRSLRSLRLCASAVETFLLFCGGNSSSASGSKPSFAKVSFQRERANSQMPSSTSTVPAATQAVRSEEHTSELQSLRH